MFTCPQRVNLKRAGERERESPNSFDELLSKRFVLLTFDFSLSEKFAKKYSCILAKEKRKIGGEQEGGRRRHSGRGDGKVKVSRTLN